MSLLTVADLNQTEEVLAPYITRAQQLGTIYTDHLIHGQADGYKYEVEVFGGDGRAQGVHASELSKCPRSLVYGIMGVERKANTQGADANMLMRFRLGQAVHALVQNDWKQIADKSQGAIRFEDEVRVSPETSPTAAQWNVQSSCDGIITCCDQGGQPEMRVGLEIKTIVDDGFRKLREPQADHYEQTTLYMKTLDLPLMWVLYYNKNNCNFTTAYHPYLFRFNKQLWEDVLEMRIAKCTHMAENNQVPAGKEGMYCKWCPFTWLCKPARLKPRPKPSGYAQGMTRRTR
jgi:CRISPR/Cas system-associated exonuclease Cas4 (RecB family)